MLVVAYRRIDPAANHRLVESFRIQFPTEVSIYIVHDRQKKEKNYMGRMHRNRKKKYRKDADLDYCL